MSFPRSHTQSEERVAYLVARGPSQKTKERCKSITCRFGQIKQLLRPLKGSFILFSVHRYNGILHRPISINLDVLKYSK